MSKLYGLMADLHLHKWSSFSKELETGLNSRLQLLLDEIERCAVEVAKSGGDTVVMAGDVFHVRGSVAPSVLNPTIDRLQAIHLKHGTKFIIIPGNHDLEGKETTRLGSAVTALARSYIHIQNEPEYIDSLNACVFPWFEKIDDLKRQLEAFATKKGEGLCSAIIHAPIDGVIAGLPMHGLSPEYLAGLRYRNVFAGHYHNHKAFEGGAVSIGALAHHTWSDIGTKAGFLIVNPDSGYKWFKSHLPEFIDLTALVEEVEAEDIPLLVDGHYIRVRVQASKGAEIEEARQELLDMGALAVLVQAEPKPPASEARVGHTISSGASLEVSVGEFIKGMKAGERESAVTAAALSVLGSV